MILAKTKAKTEVQKEIPDENHAQPNNALPLPCLSRLSMTDISSELAAACVYEDPCVALLLMTDQRVTVSSGMGGLFPEVPGF